MHNTVCRLRGALVVRGQIDIFDAILVEIRNHHAGAAIYLRIRNIRGRCLAQSSIRLLLQDRNIDRNKALSAWILWEACCYKTLSPAGQNNVVDGDGTQSAIEL